MTTIMTASNKKCRCIACKHWNPMDYLLGCCGIDNSIVRCSDASCDQFDWMRKKDDFTPIKPLISNEGR